MCRSKPEASADQICKPIAIADESLNTDASMLLFRVGSGAVFRHLATFRSHRNANK